MNEIIAAIASVIGTLVITVVTYVLASRAGIGPFQDNLVSKLKDLVAVQQTEINVLKEKNKEYEGRIATLETTVEELKELTISQAKTIDDLQKNRPIRARRRKIIVSPEIQKEEN